MFSTTDLLSCESYPRTDFMAFFWIEAFLLMRAPPLNVFHY